MRKGLSQLLVTAIALLTGGWMLVDGSHVLLTGVYLGPKKPGPWSDLVASLGINPFHLGVPFLMLGGLWLLFLVAMLFRQHWAWYGAILTAIATLWYLPIGTAGAVVYLLLLFTSFRPKRWSLTRAEIS